MLFASMFICALVAHEIADHLLQTDEMAAHKAEPGGFGWAVATLHGLVHLWVTVGITQLMLVATGQGAHLGGYCAGLAVIGASHTIIDRRWPVRWLLKHLGAPGFAALTTPISGMYLADQALHKLFLFIGALLMAAL